MAVVADDDNDGKVRGGFLVELEAAFAVAKSAMLGLTSASFALAKEEWEDVEEADAKGSRWSPR